MRAWSVDGGGDRRVPGQIRAELMFVVRGEHVGRIVVVGGSSATGAGNNDGSRSRAIVLAGITHCFERMGPTEADAVHRRQFLGCEQPSAVALTFVLERNQRVHVA